VLRVGALSVSVSTTSCRRRSNATITVFADGHSSAHSAIAKGRSTQKTRAA
jgi:hypothetical protein